MTFTAQRLLDTTPRWLSITLVSTSSALLISGVGFVLNLKVKLPAEKRALLAIGVAVAVGSIWGAVQQWAAYLQAGIVNDITLVAGAVAMDAVGGLVVYILYHLNILGRKIGSSGP